MNIPAPHPAAPLRIALAAALLTALAAPAPACVPPLPGEVEPSEAEKVEWVGKSATDIVYGVVTRDDRRGAAPLRFKVLHVYRGRLAVGASLHLEPGWGLDSPGCPGMIVPPPVPRGAWGVAWFSGEPRTLNFLSEAQVRLLLDGGWIRSARAGRN